MDFILNGSETVTSHMAINETTDTLIERMRASDYKEYHIATSIVLYCFPIVIIAGTGGNCLAFAVLMRRSMKDTSVYFYLAMLAIADTFVLYLSCFKTWIRTLVDFELLHTSTAGCKIIMFLFLVSMHMAAWLVVAMTVDRFVAVWFPFKASEVCVVKRARLISGLIILIIVIYNFHLFFTIHLQEMRGHRLHCGPMYDDYFMVEIFPKMRVISYSILPFILVLLFNLAIIGKLCTNSSLLKTTRESSGSAANAQHKVTIMLLIVSLTWLLLSAPFTLEPLFRTAITDNHMRAKQFLHKTIYFLLLYLNHSINFYIYCVTGRKFRCQLLELFSCCSKRQNAIVRVQSTFESKTTKTHLNNAKPQWPNGEAIPLKNTVLVTYED